MLAFFRCPSYVIWPSRCLNSTKIVSKVYQKSVKMEAWGGSGGSWGSSWRHLGPKTAQSSKKLEKVSSSTLPQGPSWEPKFEKKVIWRHFVSFFSSCFCESRFFIDFR